ncbi:MAG TPA: DUF2231 domain-containing protein [Usitatibacter sp.]|nr:DUF2231 domain-containing protein [Usitatibacter sp.]
MRTPASIAGHPIHPMVVPIAIGGFILSFAFDIVCLASGNMDPWATVAYFTMIGGIVGALIAAVFGFTDYASLSDVRIKHIASMHMALNLTIVILYIVNAWVRHGNPSSLKGPMLLSLLCIILLIISGWLGGKMVYECGVAVSPDGEGLRGGSTAPRNRHVEA